MYINKSYNYLFSTPVCRIAVLLDNIMANINIVYTVCV